VHAAQTRAVCTDQTSLEEIRSPKRCDHPHQNQPRHKTISGSLGRKQLATTAPEASLQHRCASTHPADKTCPSTHTHTRTAWQHSFQLTPRGGLAEPIHHLLPTGTCTMMSTRTDRWQTVPDSTHTALICIACSKARCRKSALRLTSSTYGIYTPTVHGSHPHASISCQLAEDATTSSSRMKSERC
jgi:hypothetical protein